MTFSYLPLPKCLSGCPIWKNNEAIDLPKAATPPPLISPPWIAVSKSLAPTILRVDKGLYILLSMVGLSACKATCFAVNANPSEVKNINLAILTLSWRTLSI